MLKLFTEIVMTSINRLTQNPALVGTDIVPIWDQTNGRTRAVLAETILEFTSGSDIVSAKIVNDHLILVEKNGTEIDAGPLPGHSGELVYNDGTLIGNFTEMNFGEGLTASVSSTGTRVDIKTGTSTSFAVSMTITTVPAQRLFDADITQFIVNYSVSSGHQSETIESGAIKINGTSHAITEGQSSITITQTVAHSEGGVSVEGDFVSTEGRQSIVNHTVHFERVYVYLKADKDSIVAADLDTGSRHDVSIMPSEITMTATDANGNYFIAELLAASNPTQYNTGNYRSMSKTQQVTWHDEVMQIYRTLNPTHVATLDIHGVRK